MYRHYGGCSLSFVDGHVAHKGATEIKANITNDFKLP
jgi:prepilin-type processing-associated H-X9-DG protein